MTEIFYVSLTKLRASELIFLAPTIIYLGATTVSADDSCFPLWSILCRFNWRGLRRGWHCQSFNLSSCRHKRCRYKPIISLFTALCTHNIYKNPRPFSLICQHQLGPMNVIFHQAIRLQIIQDDQNCTSRSGFSRLEELLGQETHGLHCRELQGCRFNLGAQNSDAARAARCFILRICQN